MIEYLFTRLTQVKTGTADRETIFLKLIFRAEAETVLNVSSFATEKVFFDPFRRPMFHQK